MYITVCVGSTGFVERDWVLIRHDLAFQSPRTSANINLCIKFIHGVGFVVKELRNRNLLILSETCLASIIYSCVEVDRDMEAMSQRAQSLPCPGAAPLPLPLRLPLTLTLPHAMQICQHKCAPVLYSPILSIRIVPLADPAASVSNGIPLQLHRRISHESTYILSIHDNATQTCGFRRFIRTQHYTTILKSLSHSKLSSTSFKVNFSYCRSLLTYDIIFWGNFSRNGGGEYYPSENGC